MGTSKNFLGTSGDSARAQRAPQPVRVLLGRRGGRRVLVYETANGQLTFGNAPPTPPEAKIIRLLHEENGRNAASAASP